MLTNYNTLSKKKERFIWDVVTIAASDEMLERATALEPNTCYFKHWYRSLRPIPIRFWSAIAAIQCGWLHVRHQLIVSKYNCPAHGSRQLRLISARFAYAVRRSVRITYMLNVSNVRWNVKCCHSGFTKSKRRMCANKRIERCFCMNSLYCYSETVSSRTCNARTRSHTRSTCYMKGERWNTATTIQCKTVSLTCNTK